MEVHVLPALADNYMYIIVDKSTKDCAVVDPVNPALISKFIDNNGLSTPKIALTTHHHLDHSGGNEELSRRIPNMQILGGSNRIPSVSKIVTHEEICRLGQLNIQCLHTPCHTNDHMCYYVYHEYDSSNDAVFTGDTLFIGGCGKFFEGTATDMYHSLLTVIGKLPPTTKVYCGHEYTETNLRFAMTIEPENVDIAKKYKAVKVLRSDKKFTVPSTLADELKTNVFMRVSEENIMKHCKTRNPMIALETLRKQKDGF